MKKFGIIRNTEKERTAVVSTQIQAYLARHGADSYVSATGADLPDDLDCGIVLGGDGTLLRAAKVVLMRQLPLMGINLGNLGYLAEIDVKNMDIALDKLMMDEYTIENRMMIHGTVFHEGKREMADVALNDIVLRGKKPMRAYDFQVFVNDAYLTTYHADGVIVSTATGSTGYNLSAGGPIVSPEARSLLLTPLAPHSLISRSIILRGGDKIRIEVGEGRMGQLCDVAAASFDGGGNISLETGDVVKIRRSEKQTQIIKMNNISFLEVLRRKMADA
ncbi:MAG: NAD(+)/NADH kinase [Lachnospiraceae bacterium]|nr:NAD(+)/NADH kinase [Lachnospiraceae bacterium]